MKSLYINKLTNLITKNGNKHTSESKILQSFKKLQKDSIKQPYSLLQTAVKRLVPIYRLQILTNKKRRRKNRKIKKKACLIINPSLRLSLALKYLISGVKNRKGLKISESLATEIASTCQGGSEALNKKHDDHKEITTNRNYIRRYYRWKR